MSRDGKRLTRIAYVGGRYCQLSEPAIRIEDRGFQFADGVYEVIKVVDGRIGDLERHLDRLTRSLSELGIPMPMSPNALETVLRETYRRNTIRQAILYLQITRGAAPRNHVSSRPIPPTVVVTCRRAPFPTQTEQTNGVSVITVPDQRWARCDVKSISLLANVLAKQAAASQDCREAWLYDADGMIHEGASSNAFIIDRDGRIITHPLDCTILGGVTRSYILELAREAGLSIDERAFSVEEAHNAREAFLTSTTSLVLPVTSIDGRPVANGYPGSETRKLAQLYAAQQGLRANQEKFEN